MTPFDIAYYGFWAAVGAGAGAVTFFILLSLIAGLVSAVILRS